jgi:hypothetical protein
MADFAFDDSFAVDIAPDGASVTTLINWLGALVSLALIAGLATWGWQLLQRDVSGVPVITALEGPMRIAPDNPGGSIAEHQGLAVNRIPAVGEAAPGADTVVLAPQPVSLTDEDAAMSTLLPDTRDDMSAEQSAVAEIQDLSATDLAVITALAELDDGLSAELSVTTDAEAEPALGGSANAIAASPRPVPRPDINITAETQATPVSSSAAGLDVSADAVTPGTRLVQLGAFPSIDEAKAEWGRIDTAFSDYMGEKRRVIQEAETGGTTFYRLRVMGFDDLSDARRFCAVLVAGDASCIPVVAR